MYSGSRGGGGGGGGEEEERGRGEGGEVGRGGREFVQIYTSCDHTVAGT